MSDGIEKERDIFMIHVDDDTLLKSVLKLLNGPDESSAQDHLSKCSGCRKKLVELQGEVAALEHVAFTPEMIAPPRLPRVIRRRSSAFAMAAVLVAGFIGGFITSDLTYSDQTVVIQQQLQPTSASVSPAQYVSCEPVDISY